MQPFDSIPPALEQGINSLDETLSARSLAPHAPYSALRALSLHAMEGFSQALSHQAALFSSSQDIRRQLALIRRTDARQQITLSSLPLPHGDEPSRGIFLSMLGLEFSAALAQRLPEGEIRKALDFTVPEYQDAIYRLSNLLMLEKNMPAQKILGGYAEIMPGRPLIACQRHPYDDVKHAADCRGILEEMAPLILAAVAEAQRGFFMQAVSHAENAIARGLYAELSLLAEEHRTLFSSLIPRKDPLEQMLLCQYTEAYLYSSWAETEENDALRQLYRQEGAHELTHIRKAHALCIQEGKAIDLPAFPPFLQLGPQKGYVRDMLQNAGVTGLREGYSAVGSLPPGADFFRYQQKLFPHPEKAPSHQIIAQLIEKTGEDYRYEIAPHPLEGMRNRQQDSLKIGR